MDLRTWKLELRFDKKEAPTDEFLDQFKMCKKLKYLYFHFIGSAPVDYCLFADKFDGMQLVSVFFRVR